MIPALLLLAVLTVGPKGPEARFRSAQVEFNRGNFGPALRQLDAAVAETKDDKLLSQVQLLRGQVFAVKGDYDRAEAAFLLALEADSEATLDPARIDPRLVGMLDGIRQRTLGPLQVTTATPGTRVQLDGRAAGITPLSTEIPIGRHVVEGKSSDGKKAGRTEVVVRSKKSVEVELVMFAVPPKADGRGAKEDAHLVPEEKTEENAPTAAPSNPNELRGFADLRPAWAPTELLQGLGFEVGGGVERQYLRAELSARLVQYFGLTPRIGLHVPIVPKLEGIAEGELPFLFPSTVAIGVGGAAGAEYTFNPWVSAFAQAGFRYYFVRPDTYSQSQFLLQFGARLRWAAR